ncbi:hypothetical protein IAU60_006027 [Kwoniella sp. DSM 27419]
MNTTARRLLSTSSRLAQEAVAPSDSSSPVAASSLPRLLQKQIAKRLLQVGSSTGSIPPVVEVVNPFVLQRGSRRADSEITGEARYHWRKPEISNRRQKQMLALYPGFNLPASRLNHQGLDRPVQWDEGVTIKWTGEVKRATEGPVQKKGTYSGRKTMFKGHKDERDKAQKQADRKARMDGMEKRIADWKQGRIDEKIRNRPSLPF